MQDDLVHWLILGSLVLLIGLAIANLAVVLREKKEGYFSSGHGGFGNPNSLHSGFGSYPATN